LKKGYKDVAQLLGPEEERQPWPKECQGNERRNIFLAARYGHVECVDILLERGEDIDAVDRFGYTALLWAAYNGQVDVVKYFMDNNLSVVHKGRALLMAAQKGHTDTVKILLESGAQIEYKDSSNRTALFLASEYGHNNVTQLLLDKGAQVEHKDMLGNTPLVIASKNGHESIVKLLLDNGSYMEIEELTSLIAASQAGHTSVVQLLLKKSDNITYGNKQAALYWVRVIQ